MTDASGSDKVLTERRGKILLITMNHPEKSNSLHPDLVRAMAAILDQVAADHEIQVMVLTGAGRSFCAGLDLSLLLEWNAEQKLEYLELVTSLFQRIWQLPQPTIAAVNGPAIAGGFDLAAFCDIRLAAEEATFGQAEINVGLTQIIHPLYKSIGLARAKELAMTGDNVSALEAYRIGLVNHVYPRQELMDRALKLAEALAAKPRHALFETKRLTRELIDLDTQSALKEIGTTFARCLNSKEHTTAAAAVLESLRNKRPQ